MAQPLLFSVMAKGRLPLLAELALRSSSTGWLAAFYGALYICASTDLRASGSLWIFGWPFAAMLVAATAIHAWFGGIGEPIGMPSPFAWVRTINAVVRDVSGESPVTEVDDTSLVLTLARLPAVPLAHTLWCSGLSILVCLATAGLEWRVGAGTRNVGPIIVGGVIATLLYAAATFTACEMLVADACRRVRRVGFDAGLDPYTGPTVDTWVRVIVLVAPTVLALAVALQLTQAPALPFVWLAQMSLVVVSASVCGALGWLHALAIRRAGADLASAATALTRDGAAGLLTGAIDRHLVRMARTFNEAARAIDRSRQRSAARYAALFEGAGDAILLVEGTSGQVLEANRRAEEMTGRDAVALKQGRFADLFADVPVSVGTVDGTTRWPHGAYVRREGRESCAVDVSLSVVPLGEHTVVQAILHDMSAREGIELELRHALERLEGLYHLAVTLGGSVEQIADHLTVTLAELLDAPIVVAARLVGDELVFLARYERGLMLHEGRLPLGGTACDQVRVSRRPCIFADAATRFPDDPLLASQDVRTFVGAPVLGRGGAVEGVVAVLDTATRTVSEEDMRLLSSYAQRLARAFQEEEYGRERDDFVRKLSAQNLALSVAQERLTQADRQKSEFLGMMSHELRTPINIFIGYTELLLDDVREQMNMAPDEHGAVLERMRDAARTLASLVEDTLSVLRLESAGVAVHLEPIPMPVLCEELRAGDRFLATGATVREEWRVDADLPPIVSDRLKLRQILTNLVGNARKFTRAGTIRVHIARATDARFTITVEDTGCGIAEGELPFIFDLYRQAANGGVHNGCGIGLYIVRRYCEILGGGVTVTSEVGRGTRFTVTLPERAPAPQVAEREAAVAPEDDPAVVAPVLGRLSAA
jgi:signal transduction histidine kinase